MSDNDDEYYSAKQKTIVILPKIVSIFSIMGSSFVVYMIAFHRHKKPKTTYHRLMLGMSSCDVLVSFWFFLTTWPIPKELAPNVWGAHGNQATCDAQGWFSQFSIAVVMYNASLSVYYLVKIRFGWRTSRITKYVEPFLHLWSLGFGIVTSTIALLLKAYNNDSWECWISPYPLDCQESWNNNGQTNCIRGNNASLYRWVLYYAWLWAAILTVCINMYLVYRGVKRLERRFDRYSDARRLGEVHNKNTKLVARQGYLYCSAFLLTWIFPTITRMVQVTTGQTPYPLIILTSIFVPMQGAFNAVVYIIPRFWKQNNKKKKKRGQTRTSTTSSEFTSTAAATNSTTMERIRHPMRHMASSLVYDASVPFSRAPLESSSGQHMASSLVYDASAPFSRATCESNNGQHRGSSVAMTSTSLDQIEEGGENTTAGDVPADVDCQLVLKETGDEIYCGHDTEPNVDETRTSCQAELTPQINM